MPNRNNDEGTPLLVAVAAVIVLSSLKGCGDGREKVSPPVPSVARAFANYGGLMTDAWRDGAERLDRGELTTDRAAYDWIDERARLARQAAFAPVHQREQAVLGDGRWNAEANARLWRAFADETVKE